MSARRSRLMDGLFREQLQNRRAPLSGSPPPSSSSSASPSDLKLTLAASASPPSSQPPPPSSQPPPDVKPLPSVLLLPPQSDSRRITPPDWRYLLPETQPLPSLSYNGSSGAMMTAAIAAIKSDEPPSRPSSSGWPGGGGGGCTSASESTRDSDEDLDDVTSAELSVGAAAIPTFVGAMDARTASSSFAAAAPATGGRHVCTICGTTFTMLGNLNRHKKSHMNVRPYNCNFCTRGFLRRTSYVEHVRLHTGEKPYLCLACGQSFVRKKCFQTHAKCCPGGGGSSSGIATDVAAATSGSIVGLAAASSSNVGSCGAGGHGLAGSCNGSCESVYAAANVPSTIDLVSGRAVVDAPAATAASEPLQRTVRSAVTMATVCDQRDGLIGGRPIAAAIPAPHGGTAYGSRFLGVKPLVRHQAGIGRTSFSIMKRARSTQLSRWKKQHLMALARPSQSAAHLQSSMGSSASLAAAFAGSNRGNGSLLHRATVSVGRRGAAPLAPSCSSDQRPAEQSRELLSPEGLPSAPLLPPPPPATDPFLKLTLGSGSAAAAAAAAVQHSPSRLGSAVVVPSSLSSGSYPATSLSEQSPSGGDANVSTGTPSHRPVSSPVPFVAPAAGAVGVGPLGLVSSPSAVAANVSLLLRSPSAGTGCSSTGTGGPAVAATAATTGVAGIMESSATLLPRDVKLFHCRHCDIYFANLVTFLLHRGLHGEGDPLKCSICGKLCRDANEFLIHH